MYNFVGTHGTSGTHWCIPYSYQRVKCVPQLLFSWHTLAVSGTHCYIRVQRGRVLLSGRQFASTFHE